MPPRDPFAAYAVPDPFGAYAVSESTAVPRAPATSTAGREPLLRVAERALLSGIVPAAGAAGGILGGSAGAAAGGIGAVPGAIGGATLFGSAAELARQVLAHQLGLEPQLSPGQSAAGVLGGAGQGALEAAGLGTARLARTGARAAMAEALRPTKQMRREFPRLIETMLSGRLPVGGKSAVPAVSAALKRAGQESRLLRLGAAWRGLRLTPQRIIGPTQKVIEEVSQARPGQLPVALSPREQSIVFRTLREFQSKARSRMTPEYVQALKRTYQAESEAVFRAERKGAVVGPMRTLEARTKRIIADRLKQALETGIPGHRARESAVRELIGAHRAVEEAGLSRGMPLMFRAGIPLTVGSLAAAPSGSPTERATRFAGGLLAARAVMSPTVASRLALALSDPRTQALLRQSPRAAAALLQLLEVPQE